jgi:hypothetical protein
MNLDRTRAGLLSHQEAEAEYQDFLDREYFDPLFGRLYDLLDGTDPLFVPCELASKKPSVLYADLTHDNMDWLYGKKLYEVAVNEGNLAVKLGPISGDLCTIDLDRDELIEPFLELNPKLRETLRTKGKKGCQFWFKVDGPYPEKVVPLVDGGGKPVGEWRAGGNGLSTIYGVHPSSARHIKAFAPPYRWLRYRFVVEKPIVTLLYDDITIPTDWTVKKRKPGEPWKWSSNSEDEDSPAE